MERVDTANLYALRGPQGPKGDPGHGIFLRGVLAAEEDLPFPGIEGDAYIIDGDLWGWNHETDTWINAGPVVGPQGPQGPRGYPGPSGGSTSIMVYIDGGEGTIETMARASVTMPYEANLTGWRILSPQGTGSLVLSLHRSDYASYPSTTEITTVGSRLVLDNEQIAEDLAVSGWDEHLDSGDILIFQVESATGLSVAEVTILSDRLS